MLNYMENMTQRNMLCTNPMPDLEMDQQGQSNPQSGHCMFLGNIAHYPQHPNLLPVLSASGNTSNIDLRRLPEHEGSIFFANQFNGLQQHHPITNFNLGAPSNYYNPYMIPSSVNRICPVPLHRGSSDQPQSSGHRGLIGVTSNDYDGNSHLIDGARSSGKRKNAEGFPGNHNANGLASSSSSSSDIVQNAGIPQMPERFQSGAGVLDVASFQPPDYRVNSTTSVPATSSRRSVRSRSNDAGHQVDSNQLHNQNHVVQGNYMGQAFQPTSSQWVEQQFGNNGCDGGSSTWNSTTAMPYMHGRSVSGASLDVTGMTGQGFPPDTMNGRSSAMFLHPSVQHHQFHPHLHPPPIQSMQGHNYHPQPAIPTYRNPTSNSLNHGTSNPYVDGPDSLLRYPRALPSNGIRIYRPQRIGNRQSASNSSHQPHLRILAEDEVAILEIPGFYEVGGHIDQHRDMRLDIDDMSYEELLALGERIGSVKTGLSAENISRCLKTRVHFSSEKDDMDQEMVGGTCIICQLDYENEENLGILECGHEYHADCIKQWLVLKNVCPICKMPALSI